ncbi:MAG TPA: hypothetical protein VIJ33_06355, partial [Solirubrobacteraceae bacterium]
MRPSSEHDGGRGPEESRPEESRPEESGPEESGLDATVTASAQLPELDERALAVLGQVGRSWAGCMPARRIWERALPVDRRLDFADPQQSRSGRFVHIRSARRGADDNELEATAEADEGDSRSGHVAYALRRALI